MTALALQAQESGSLLLYPWAQSKAAGFSGSKAGAPSPVSPPARGGGMSLFKLPCAVQLRAEPSTSASRPLRGRFG